MRENCAQTKDKSTLHSILFEHEDQGATSWNKSTQEAKRNTPPTNQRLAHGFKGPQCRSNRHNKAATHKEQGKDPPTGALEKVGGQEPHRGVDRTWLCSQKGAPCCGDCPYPLKVGSKCFHINQPRELTYPSHKRWIGDPHITHKDTCEEEEM